MGKTYAPTISLNAVEAKLDEIITNLGGTPETVTEPCSAEFSAPGLEGTLNEIIENLGGTPETQATPYAPSISVPGVEGRLAQIADLVTGGSDGTEITNKKLVANITVVNNTQDGGIACQQCVGLSDGELMSGMPSMLDGATKAVAYYYLNEVTQSPLLYTNPTYITGVTYENAVNCTVSENESSYAVFITDFSADASIDLTLTFATGE